MAEESRETGPKSGEPADPVTPEPAPDPISYKSTTKQRVAPSTPSSTSSVASAETAGSISEDEPGGRDGDSKDNGGQAIAEPGILRLSMAKATYAGPMPPPDLLKAYAKVSPELPTRIMAMAEKAMEHAVHQDMEKLRAARIDMECNWQVVRRGQLFGLMIGSLALIVAAVALAISPNAAGATVGTVIGGGGIGTLIWAFRYDRRHYAPTDIADPTGHYARPSWEVESENQQNEHGD